MNYVWYRIHGQYASASQTLTLEKPLNRLGTSDFKPKFSHEHSLSTLNWSPLSMPMARTMRVGGRLLYPTTHRIGIYFYLVRLNTIVLKLIKPTEFRAPSIPKSNPLAPGDRVMKKRFKYQQMGQLGRHLSKTRSSSQIAMVLIKGKLR